MIVWSIAQIALMGTLLALASYGADAALRTSGRPTRWAWVSALLLTVAMAALVPLRSMTTAPAASAIPMPTATAAAPLTAAPTGLLDTLRALWSTSITITGDAVRDLWTLWHATVPAGTDRLLLIAWTAASLALLVIFAAVHLRFARRRAQWPVGTLHDTTVRIADDTGPAVIGVARAEIVVPAWLLSRDDQEQRLVLAHEREHVRLHDPLLLAMAQAAIVLLPWHPAVWWMASRLRLAVELDCDRRVLQRGVNARDYGTLLIDLTDHRSGFGAALPAFSCTPSHLERRLIAMTPKKLRYPLVRVASAGALASLALLAACEAKLPTADEVNNMTAASATTTAGKIALMDSTKVTYVVNGAEVRSDVAEAIPADSIAEINVSKTKRGTGRVEIVTRKAGDAPRAQLRKEEVDTTTQARVSGITLAPARAGESGEAPRGAITAVGPNNARQPFTGLVVLDGVPSDMSAMNRIQPDQIASVNIIKGAAATAKYSDPRAANGVIEIVTKSAVKP